MVYTHKKFDDPEMVQESCKTKLIWLKLEELNKILRESRKTRAKVAKTSNILSNSSNLSQINFVLQLS